MLNHLDLELLVLHLELLMYLPLLILDKLLLPVLGIDLEHPNLFSRKSESL